MAQTQENQGFEPFLLSQTITKKHGIERHKMA